MDRWNEVLTLLVDILRGRSPQRVVVRGDEAQAAAAAGRLGDALHAAGGSTVVATGDADGDVVIGLRQRRPGGSGTAADIVVDLSDPDWPVVRHVDPALGYPPSWHDRETRAFFAVRAATWDSKFGDDGPAYARAVREMKLPLGATVLDVGCGTGRALPALRTAVGPQGTVVGLDFTPQMLDVARPRGHAARAHLVLANARRLPVRPATATAIFAAGLVGHAPDVDPVLTELARVCAPGGRLALFHASGRAALATRHGRVLSDDEAMAEPGLRAALHRAGWGLFVYDDAVDRFFALALRHTDVGSRLSE
jgi:SAM-dependent methyltransferase